jgi:hypothetical protein
MLPEQTNAKRQLGARVAALEHSIKAMLSKLKRHELLVILAIGIVARLILIPISAHPLDMNIWYREATTIAEHGPTSVSLFPPVNNFFMLIPVAYAYDALANIFGAGTIAMNSLPAALNFYPGQSVDVVPGFLFNTVLKGPLLISDILVTLCLFKLTKQVTGNLNLAKQAALIWFLNPLVIWISAAWGMWDTFAVLFTLVSMYFLLRRSLFASSAFLVLGIVTKAYPIVFLLPFTAYILKTSPPEERRKNIMKYYSLVTATIVVVTIIFGGALMEFFRSLFIPTAQNVGLSQPVPVAFGLTWWSVAQLNPAASIANAPFIYGTSSVLVATAMLIVGWKIRSMRFEKPELNLALAMLLCIFALFLSFRLVLEQWVIATIPLMTLLVVCGLMKKRIFWTASFAAFFYGMLNCPLPFFFLPLAASFKEPLLEMVYAIWAFEPIKTTLLAGLGVAFSLSIILFLRGIRTEKIETASDVSLLEKE